MESAGDRVQVYCRVRPHVDQGDALQRRCVSVSREHAQIVLHSASDDKAFTFDHAGDEHTSQEDVFRAVGMPITEACMAGYNTTIFAYGQTGAGKTYTILGPDTPAHAEGADGVPADDAGCAMHEQAGLTPRVLAYIFAQIARIERTSEGGASFLCKCSYLEIYNENLTDLLVVDPSASPLPPRLRENLHRGIYVESLETVDVRTPAEALAVLAVGATHRRVAATSMNKESSRSHAVFTLTIESQTIAPSGLKSTRSSQFNLVDLAGSERQRDTGATGQRLTEACNINKSLSALGNVIMALVTSASGRARHVPYRDSKLTLLLKDSLGGNARTAIIANISPLARMFAETLSTLKFAQRAKMIRNNAVVNEESTGGLVALQSEIRRLREALAISTAAEHAPGQDDALARAALRAGADGSWQKLERDVALRDSLERERAAVAKLGSADAQLAKVAELAARHAGRQRALCLLVRLREAQLCAAGSKLAPAAASASVAAQARALDGAGARELDGEGGGDVPAEAVLAALQHAYDHHPDVVRLALEREELAAALAAVTADEAEAMMAKLRRDVDGLRGELLRQVRESIALREHVAHLELAAADGASSRGDAREIAAVSGGSTPHSPSHTPASCDRTAETRALRAALAASESALVEMRAAHERAARDMATEHERDVGALMAELAVAQAGAAEAEGKATRAEARRARTQAEMEAIVDEYEQLAASVAAADARGAAAVATTAAEPGAPAAFGSPTGASARAAALIAAEHELAEARAALADAEVARAELEASRATAEDSAAEARDRAIAAEATASNAARAAEAADAAAREAKLALNAARSESAGLEGALARALADNDKLHFDHSLLVDNNDELLETAEFSAKQVAELGAQLAQLTSAAELSAAQVAALGAQLEDARACAGQLDAADVALRAARDDADAARAELASAVAAAAAREAEARAADEAAAADRAWAERDRERLQVRVGVLEGELSAATQALGQAAAAREAAEVETRAAADAAQAAAADASEHCHALAVLRDARDALEAEHARALAAADETLASARAEWEGADTAARSAAAAAAARAQASLEQRGAELESVRAAAAEANARARAAADALAVAHAEAVAAGEARAAELARARSAASESELQLSSARAEAARNRDAAEAAAVELASARHALDAATRELAAERAALASARDALATAEAVAAAAEGAAGEAAAEASEVDALRAAIREAADERRSWLAELGALRARAAEAEAACADARERARLADDASARAAEQYSAAKAELARLVGHQNPRQKIQLHVKIKEENNALALRNRELVDHVRRLERLLAARDAPAGAAGKKATAAGGNALDADKENAGAPGTGALMLPMLPRSIADHEATDAATDALRAELAEARASGEALKASLYRVAAFAALCAPGASTPSAAAPTAKAGAPELSDCEEDADAAVAADSDAERVLAALAHLHAANGQLGKKVEDAEHMQRMLAEEGKLRHLDALATPRRASSAMGDGLK